MSSLGPLRVLLFLVRVLSSFVSSCVVCLALSLVTFFSWGIFLLLCYRVRSLGVVTFCWWFDVGVERLSGCHSFLLKDSLRISFCCFILSEVMFFFRFFWSFFELSLRPPLETGLLLHHSILLPCSLDLPLLNTFLLLSSGSTLTWGHHLFVSSKDPLVPLLLTMVLGWRFLFLQVVEYHSCSFLDLMVCLVQSSL